MTMTAITSIDKKIAEARAELQHTCKERAQARVRHEKHIESAVRQTRQLEGLIRRGQQRGTMTLRSQYIKAIQGVGDSPYIVRKQAFLLQTLHQTEVAVKQLHLSKKQAASLKEALVEEASNFKAKSHRFEETTLSECKDLTMTINKLEERFNATLRTQRDKIAEMAPFDDDDTVVSLDSTNSSQRDPTPSPEDPTPSPKDPTPSPQRQASWPRLEDSVSSIVTGFGDLFGIAYSASDRSLLVNYSGDGRKGDGAFRGLPWSPATVVSLLGTEKRPISSPTTA